ncbi:uncharacterized protein LTR77_000283 [Saxophila tyrrhenica]|uniref:Uncharacterized protein n=1 Tax=Saxophila tyrrhenica TaxID=1690608 RepID=A0AAV9PN57_9PEZI|nr:hypothetical protein LTR77_000283 [Saxophila tyrrhenica]
MAPSRDQQLEHQQDKIDHKQEKLERLEDRAERSGDRATQERIDRQQEKLERKDDRVQQERLERKEDRRNDRRDERQQDRLDDRRDDHDDYRRDNLESASSPIFHPGKPTKILISPGQGAGWITYAPKNASDDYLVWMLTYEPLIRALERRERKDRLEEILKDFHREARQKFNVERIMCARVGDLAVQEVVGPFEVREKNGAEWIVDARNARSRRIVPMGAVVY